jgi:hypothetical protein
MSIGIALRGRISKGGTAAVSGVGAGDDGVETSSVGAFAAAAPRDPPNTLPTRGIGIGSRVVLEGRGRGVEAGGRTEGGAACGAEAGAGAAAASEATAGTLAGSIDRWLV